MFINRIHYERCPFQTSHALGGYTVIFSALCITTLSTSLLVVLVTHDNSSVTSCATVYHSSGSVVLLRISHAVRSSLFANFYTSLSQCFLLLRYTGRTLHGDHAGVVCRILFTFVLQGADNKTVKYRQATCLCRYSNSLGNICISNHYRCSDRHNLKLVASGRRGKRRTGDGKEAMKNWRQTYC